MNGQEHKITIEAQLDDQKDILRINQSIIYQNTSDSTLNYIILHNWVNGYKNNKSPLANRLIEDYDKSLFFAKQKDRGFSIINNLTVDFEKVKFLESEKEKMLRIDSITQAAINKGQELVTAMPVAQDSL